MFVVIERKAKYLDIFIFIHSVLLIHKVIFAKTKGFINIGDYILMNVVNN